LLYSLFHKLLIQPLQTIIKNTLYTLPLGKISTDFLRDGRDIILKKFGQDVLDRIITAAKDEQCRITERINNISNRINNDTVYLAFSSDIEYFFRNT